MKFLKFLTLLIFTITLFSGCNSNNLDYSNNETLTISAAVSLKNAFTEIGEFGATLMITGNIPGKTQPMPLAIYEAVASGDDRRAQILALILTAISIAAIYFTNKISRSRIYG